MNRNKTIVTLLVALVVGLGIISFTSAQQFQLWKKVREVNKV